MFPGPNAIPLLPPLSSGLSFRKCGRKFSPSGVVKTQAAVPVLEGDTPETLSARVLLAEHELYPHALQLVASGQARVEKERVTISGQPKVAAPLINPPLR